MKKKMALFIPFIFNEEEERKKERMRIEGMKKLCHSAFQELEEVLEDEMLKRWEQHKLSYRIEEMLYDVRSILEEWDGLDEDTIFWLRGLYFKTFYKYQVQF